MLMLQFMELQYVLSRSMCKVNGRLGQSIVFSFIRVDKLNFLLPEPIPNSSHACRFMRYRGLIIVTPHIIAIVFSFTDELILLLRYLSRFLVPRMLSLYTTSRPNYHNPTY